MANRPKIALCLEYPLLLRGGVSVLVETLLHGLHEHFDLVLVSADSQGSLAGHPIAQTINQHLSWDSAQVSPQTSRHLANELAKCGVQLAHFHLGGVFGWGNRFPNHSPITYLRRHGIAACTTVHLVVHPLDGYCGPKKPLWFKLALFPIAWTAKLQVLRHVQQEIAVSRHDLEKLQRWYWPLRGKFSQMYHSRLRAQSQPTVSQPREQTILNVGHIATRKGQLDLVEAFARIAPRHPAWKLCIAGAILEESIGERIRTLITAHNLTGRVELLGERDDAFQLMQRAGIYVQPSHFEALGLALQEAMFHGCPAIGARVGGIPELIEDQTTGLLFEPGNVAALTQALESLMANPGQREQFGRAGAAAIVRKGMTEEQMFANHIRLYESILRDF